MKWWLISDDNVNRVKDGLMAHTHKANEDNCHREAYGGDCRACVGGKLRVDALHALETGLHVTDEVPKDFEEGGE